jgi:hypothetical protein
MSPMTRKARNGRGQIRATPGARAARLCRSAPSCSGPVAPRRRRHGAGGAQRIGSDPGTGRVGAIWGRNLADGGSPRREVAEPGRQPRLNSSRSGQVFTDTYGAPPAGFEPAHTAPECNAQDLSDLREPGLSRDLRALSGGIRAVRPSFGAVARPRGENIPGQWKPLLLATGAPAPAGPGAALLTRDYAGRSCAAPDSGRDSG